MNRSQLLTTGAAAGAAALTGCVRSTPASLVPPPGYGADFILPTACEGKSWRVQRHGSMGKIGGRENSIVYHKTEPLCTFKEVGGFELYLQVDRAGAWIHDELSFWAGARKATYTLYDIQASFWRRNLVKLFEEWYYKVNADGNGGTLYDSKNNTLGVAKTNWQVSHTELTLYPGGGRTFQWEHDWKKWPGDDISAECAFALMAYFGACSLWVSSVLAAELGPLEWMAIVGSTAALFAAAGAVLDYCNR